ncbi:hypothetical protein GCM10008955_10110 [Deinococcus malanensis]|uniref:Uncharacterized protein n=1 Tax=Deinococcus malanensis TaxID=1706855 RepID=A0ABQ2ERC6_9DEIO|nr:hypothetical protein GCM10008955_10110 [Deinococcus malanensis]
MLYECPLMLLEEECSYEHNGWPSVHPRNLLVRAASAWIYRGFIPPVDSLQTPWPSCHFGRGITQWTEAI